MNFKYMDKKKLKRISSKGGKTKAINEKKRNKELSIETFKEIVRSEITRDDLLDLYHGALESAKKGNMKAIELILKTNEKNKECNNEIEL